MRKYVFRICENKDADKLRGNRNPSTFSIWNFKPLAIFCRCAAQFVSDLVREPDNRFSCDATHLTNKQGPQL